MDDSENGPFKIGERLFETCTRWNIQMIDRLIEQQECATLRD